MADQLTAAAGQTAHTAQLLAAATRTTSDATRILHHLGARHETRVLADLQAQVAAAADHLHAARRLLTNGGSMVAGLRGDAPPTTPAAARPADEAERRGGRWRTHGPAAALLLSVVWTATQAATPLWQRYAAVWQPLTTALLVTFLAAHALVLLPRWPDWFFRLMVHLPKLVLIQLLAENQIRGGLPTHRLVSAGILAAGSAVIVVLHHRRRRPHRPRVPSGLFGDRVEPVPGQQSFADPPHRMPPTYAALPDHTASTSTDQPRSAPLPQQPDTQTCGI